MQCICLSHDLYFTMVVNLPILPHIRLHKVILQSVISLWTFTTWESITDTICLWTSWGILTRQDAVPSQHKPHCNKHPPGVIFRFCLTLLVYTDIIQHCNHNNTNAYLIFNMFWSLFIFSRLPLKEPVWVYQSLLRLNTTKKCMHTIQGKCLAKTHCTKYLHCQQNSFG